MWGNLQPQIEPEQQEERAGLLDWIAGRLPLSEESSPPKHCPPPDSALLFFYKGGNSLQFPKCQLVLSYHSLAIQLWLAWNRGGDVEPANRHLLHFHMPLTAAGRPAGQRESNTVSLPQMAVLLCNLKGRCFTPLLMLINFLMCHSSSFPAVTSSALFPCGSTFISHDVWHQYGSSKGQHEPVVVCCRGLTRPGRQLSRQPELSLTWQYLSVSSPTLESFFPCCTGPCSRAGIWLTCIARGYAWRLPSSICRLRLSGEAGGAT